MNTSGKQKKMQFSFQSLRGSFIVIAPVLLLMMIGFSGLVVDISMMRTVKARLQTATDAAALAGANALTSGSDAAVAAVNASLISNKLVGSDTAKNIQIEVGKWDDNSKQFTVNSSSPAAVRVNADADAQPLFSTLLGMSGKTFSSQSTASLMSGDKDVVFIVDLTPAMSLYSQLGAYPTLSLTAIEQNLLAVYNALNLPQLGNMQWTPQLLLGNANSIITQLGLDNVSYPYPSGTWNDYINYVKTDATLVLTGYSNRYGYLTFVNYLQAQKGAYTETPTLWKTPEQPLYTLKTSLSTFVTSDLGANDRAALVIYNYGNGNTAYVEQTLTSNVANIPAILNGDVNTNTVGRQAGHYGNNSDMLSGINAAVSELTANGRTDAKWEIYLLTSSALSNNGLAAIKNQAESMTSANIVLNIVTLEATGTISVLQEVANETGGTLSQSSPMVDFSSTLSNMSSLSGTAQLVH